MQNADLLWESTLASACFVFFWFPAENVRRCNKSSGFEGSQKTAVFAQSSALRFRKIYTVGGGESGGGESGGFLGITNQSHKAASLQTGGGSEIE